MAFPNFGGASADQGGGASGAPSTDPAKLREAIATLRAACTSASSRQALRTVESDVLQGDTSKNAAPSSRNTPGGMASGSAKKGQIPPQFLKH